MPAVTTTAAVTAAAMETIVKTVVMESHDDG